MYIIKQQKNIITIKTNIDIPESIENEFIFCLLNKNNNILYKRKIKKKSFEIDKYYEIKKYELKLESKIIRTSKNIINTI